MPGSAVDATVGRLDDVTRVRYETDHFGPYAGAAFERAVEREGAFLERRLLDGD